MRRRACAAVLVLLAASACTRAGPPAPVRPVRGGTLVVSVRSLGTLDPARAEGRGSLLSVAQVFDPLTAIDPVTGAVGAAAAASWTASANGLVWRFTLRQAVFHDGRPVRARDFEFAFDRVARRSTESGAAFQLSSVKGFGDVHDTGEKKTLAGVRTRGERLLEITLARPFAELPYALAHPALAPLPFGKYGKSTKGLATAPVGNGPFRVERATSGTGARLVRSGRYRGAAAYLDAVELRVEPEVDEGWRAVLDGEVHVADVPSAAIDVARARFGPDGFTPFWAALEFGVNLVRAKYRKPEVRRAISLAIDRQAIASTVYGNTKEAATGLIPRGVRGYLPDACTSCTLDRTRARALVKAAFGAKPPAIRVDHLNDATSRRVATAIANDLKQVGFKASLKGYTRGAYLKLLDGKDHDLAQLGWLAAVPTPDGFLAQQLRTGSADNSTGFKDATFDRAINRARAQRVERARLDAYQQAESRALELMPLIPIVFFRNRTAAGQNVRGYVLDGAGLFDASRIWLAR